MSRHGKIARLPRALRDQVNGRLDNGEPAVRLAEWLNRLPEVQEILRSYFEGHPISEQNMSEWKSGGYREWLARQEMLAQTRELTADAKELSDAADGRLTDHLATALAARYAAALVSWNGETSEDFTRDLRSLRALCQDIVELRRGDHSGARLNIEQERLEREREKTEEEVAEHFKRWAENPAVREWMCKSWTCPEERERRIREILGLPSQTPDPPPAASLETNKSETTSG